MHKPCQHDTPFTMALIAYWLIAPLPLFLPLLFVPRVTVFGNSDALFYGNILTLMSESLKGGELFPRWFGDANAGFGSPVMMFYAPLAYIVTALINLPLAPLHADATTQLVIGMYASQVACGVTSYFWLKRSFPPCVALAGSLLFVLLPYKLIYIYIHVNLAQLWALALLPLWMMAAQALIAGSVRALGLYALIFAGVYYSHPLTLLAFGAVPAAYALWFGRRELLRNSVRLGFAHILGLGLCLMQILPAHFYLPWIHAEYFLEGKYSWRNNLFHIDVVLCTYYGMIALLVGVAIRRLPSLRESKNARRGLFWIIVLAVVFFLTQPVSTWVWELLTPLQYLQFPAARLHAAALMGVTYLICLWLAHYKDMTSLGSIVYGRGMLAVFIVTFAFCTAYHIYNVEADRGYSSAAYLGDAQQAKIVSAATPIYENRWGCIDVKDAFALYEGKKIPAPIVTLHGDGTYGQLLWNPPARISFRADVQSDKAQFAVRQCYFPLWEARDEADHALALDADPTSGLLVLAVPKGVHDISLDFTMPRMESAARWVSFAALLACLILLLPRRLKSAQAIT